MSHKDIKPSAAELQVRLDAIVALCRRFENGEGLAVIVARKVIELAEGRKDG